MQISKAKKSQARRAYIKARKTQDPEQKRNRQEASKKERNTETRTAITQKEQAIYNCKAKILVWKQAVAVARLHIVVVGFVVVVAL